MLIKNAGFSIKILLIKVKLVSFMAFFNGFECKHVFLHKNLGLLIN